MNTTFSGAATRWTLAVLVLAAVPGTGRAQGADPLVKAKALYADAAYEEALNVLGPGEGAEAQQYRALCFIALGRNQEAERAIETLIRTSPTFKVQDGELPPRLVNMFVQTRQRVIPDVVRRLFADARTDFQAKELQRARPKFEQVLTLLKDPSMSAAADAKDLELLTTGYLDIVKNTPPPAPVPARSTAPVAAAATPPPVAASRPAPAKPVVITPAVTIRQTIPPFAVTQPNRPHPASGAVRVLIGVDGKVKSATMERPIEPRYDARVLAATKTWEFEPAMRGGEPVESEKLVEIQLESR